MSFNFGEEISVSPQQFISNYGGFKSRGGGFIERNPPPTHILKYFFYDVSLTSETLQVVCPDLVTLSQSVSTTNQLENWVIHACANNISCI